MPEIPTDDAAATINQIIDMEQTEPAEPFILIQGPSNSPIDMPNPNETAPQDDNRRHGRPSAKKKSATDDEPGSSKKAGAAGQKRRSGRKQ